MKKIKFGFNPLSFLAGILLSLSMLFPWWTLDVSSMPRPTDVYPYLIDGPASEFIGYKRSPIMTVLFILLLVCIAIFLIASFIKGKSMALSITTAGVLVALAFWRFLVRIAGVAASYDVPIQGSGVGSEGGFAKVDVFTKLQPGTYLVVAVAIIGIISGLYHNKLTNKLSFNWINSDSNSQNLESEENNDNNGG